MAQMGRAAIAALAVLLVVDVALVALALRHVQASDFGETVAAPSSSGSDGEQGQNDKGGGSGGQDKNQKPAKAPETLINVGSEGAAVGRAVTGSCQDGGAKVELSSDGGQTWTDVTPELDVVVRVSVSNEDEMTVVGSTSDCESVVAYTTSNGGGVWEETDETTWHTSLEGGASIYSPDGETVDVPCAEGEGVSAVSIISSVIALCDDGVIQTTADSGASWEHAGDVPGATALDFTSDSVGLAVVPNGEGCKGVAVMRTEDAGASWSPSGCLKADKTGKAHISASGETAYVALGTSTWTTEDGGSNWSSVGE